MKIYSNSTRAGLCLLVAFIASFAACKKETSQTSQADAEIFANVSAESAIITNAVSNDIFDYVMGINDDVAPEGVFNRVEPQDSSRTPCFTMEVIPLDFANLFPLKIVINFGAGCTDNNGV